MISSVYPKNKYVIQIYRALLIAHPFCTYGEANSTRTHLLSQACSTIRQQLLLWSLISNEVYLREQLWQDGTGQLPPIATSHA